MKNEENIIINKKKLIGVVGTTVSAILAVVFFLIAYYYDVGAFVIGNFAYGAYDGYGGGGILRIYGEVTPVQHLFLLFLILVLCVSIISTSYFSRSFLKLSRSISSRKGIVITSFVVCMIFFICWLVYLPWFYAGPLETVIEVYWYFRDMIIFVFLRDVLTAFLNIFICIKVFKVKRKEKNNC